LSREVYEGPKQVATIIKRAAERVYMENVQVLKNGIDKKEPTVPVWLMLQK